MTTLEIVGNGFSIRNYWKSADVTWGICNTMHAIDCHMGWYMDDMDDIRIWQDDFLEVFEGCTTPVMTCKAYDCFPTSQEYPLNSVLQTFGIDWLNNTVAYAVAYAIWRGGFTEIHFHGIDYMTNDAARMLERRCTEMWINFARRRGIKIKINPLSFLFDTNKKHLAELAPEVSAEMLKLWELHNGQKNYLYGYQAGLPALTFDLGYGEETWK